MTVKPDTIEYKKEQFTAWDERNFPEIYGPEYLEHETRSTGLSKNVIISYGYKQITHGENGVRKYTWVKKSEAIRPDVSC